MVTKRTFSCGTNAGYPEEARWAPMPNLVPRAFPLKNGWGGKRPLFPPHPFFKGKALGTRLPNARSGSQSERRGSHRWRGLDPLARFTDQKSNWSRITDIKLSFQLLSHINQHVYRFWFSSYARKKVVKRLSEKQLKSGEKKKQYCKWQLTKIHHSQFTHS